MPTSADFADNVERARLAARSVITGTSCELASSLLALELSRLGWPTQFVRGHYLKPDEDATVRNGHAWVEVGAVLLDPTRDQFGESVFAEESLGRYMADERRPGSEDLAYAHLALQWRVRLPKIREQIRRVCDEYRLDAPQLEDRAERILLSAPVGRS
jgi:hypothetical protein